MSDNARQESIGRKILRAIDNRRLKLTIMPTEQCNFRCTYCYEDFLRPRMRPSVVSGVKALLSSRAPSLRLLDIQWFGGEPLLALPQVLDISHHAQHLQATNPYLRFSSGMTTNAYLLKQETFRELLAAGVRTYQISLDGLGDAHNKTRRRADGGPTFDRIWSNLQDMQGVDDEFFVTIRVHFTPSTFEHIKTLVAEINRTFGDDQRFGVFFKALARLGGPNNDQIERSPPQWQLRAKAQLTRLVKRQDDGVRDPTINTYVCYAAEPNHLTIRSDGSLARCTVAFDDPRNQIGHLHADGTLSIDAERSRLWFQGLETRDEATLHCPLSTFPPLPRTPST